MSRADMGKSSQKTVTSQVPYLSVTFSLHLYSTILLIFNNEHDDLAVALPHSSAVYIKVTTLILRNTYCLTGTVFDQFATNSKI